MSLHADLRPVDRTRAVQFMTAWFVNDKDALDQVLTEADQDPDAGVAGLLFAVAEYADWMTRNTGPLTNPSPDDQELP